MLSLDVNNKNKLGEDWKDGQVRHEIVSTGESFVKKWQFSSKVIHQEAKE